MSFKFTSQKLLNGLFEPEGIYLTPPFEGELTIVQNWGENSAFYGQWNYNGVPLKGHTGIDIRIAAGARLLAVDAGRIIEISQEKGGFERYIKVEHRWGEAFYANCGKVLVETGQSVARGDVIAHAVQEIPGGKDAASGRNSTWFHFGVRIAPFNRYDGWGGFADPLPFLPAGAVILPDDAGDDLRAGFPPHPMAEVRPGLRRP